MALETKDARPVVAGIDHGIPGSDKTVLAEVEKDKDGERVIRKYAMVNGQKELPDGEGMIKES
jgi:hypothetical protein